MYEENNNVEPIEEAVMLYPEYEKLLRYAVGNGHADADFSASETQMRSLLRNTHSCIVSALIEESDVEGTRPLNMIEELYVEDGNEPMENDQYFEAMRFLCVKAGYKELSFFVLKTIYDYAVGRVVEIMESI